MKRWMKLSWSSLSLGLLSTLASHAMWEVDGWRDAVGPVQLTPLSASAGLFGTTVQEAGGWKRSAWFGWYADGYYPFVWHVSHDWVYVQPMGNWIWLWDYRTQGWLGTSADVYPLIFEQTGRSWFWYYDGTSNPRWFSELRSNTTFIDAHDCIMPKRMAEAMDQVLAVTSVIDVEDPSANLGFLQQILAPIMGGESPDCPVVTTVPENLNLGSLPPEILLTVDFGAGCIPVDLEEVVAGSVNVEITDLSLGAAGVSLKLSLVADGLNFDGVPVLSGAVAAVADIGMSAEDSETDTHWVTTTTTTINTLDIQFNEFRLLEQVMNGLVQVSGTIVNIERENTLDWEDVETTSAGNLTITLKDFSGAEFADVTGTIGIVAKEDGSVTITINLQTAEGPMLGTLQMLATGVENGFRMNSVGEIQAMGYNLRIENLLMDPSVCEDAPVSGKITIRYGASLYEFTITGDCDGNFRLTKRAG